MVRPYTRQQICDTSVCLYLCHDDVNVAIADLATLLFLAEEAIQRMEKERDDAR